MRAHISIANRSSRYKFSVFYISWIQYIIGPIAPTCIYSKLYNIKLDLLHVHVPIMINIIIIYNKFIITFAVFVNLYASYIIAYRTDGSGVLKLIHVCDLLDKFILQ